MDEACVAIRDCDPNRDHAFIYSSWRNSSYYGRPSRDIEANLYFKAQTQKIKETLRDSTVRVACLQDCPDVIIGYAVLTGTHLTWIYVKPDYRKQGIGAMLVPSHIETVTDQLTKIGIVIVEKKKLKTQGEQKNGQEITRPSAVQPGAAPAPA